MATPTELLGQARAAGAVRKPMAKPGVAPAAGNVREAPAAPSGFVRKPLATGMRFPGSSGQPGEGVSATGGTTLGADPATETGGIVRRPMADTRGGMTGEEAAAAYAKRPMWQQLRDMGMQGTGTRAGNRAALEAARMPPDAVMPPEGAPMDGDRAEMIAAAARSALGTEAPAASGPRPIGPRPFIPTELPQGGGGPQAMLPTELPQAPAGIGNPWEDLGRLGALMPPPRRRRPDIGGGVDRGMGRELATAEGYGR